MDKESFKEVTKDIQYFNLKPPVFQMPYYDIKYGELFVRTHK